MSGTSPSVRQHSFNHRDDTHGLNATTGWGTQGADWSQQTGVIFRYRVLISDTVASTKTSNYTFGLEYQINGTGGFAAVTTTTPVQATNSAQFADDDNVTSSQVTGGAGAFVTGRGDENGAAPSTGNITLGNGNDHTEIEFALLIDAAQVSNGNTIEIRATGTDVAALDYATVTVVEPVAISGIAAQTFTNAGALTSSGPTISQITGIAAMTFGLPSEFEGMLGQSLVRFIGSSATLTSFVQQGAISGTSAAAFANTSTLTATALVTGVSSNVFSNQSSLKGDFYIVSAATVTFANAGVLFGTGVLAGVSSTSFVNSGDLDGTGVLSGVSLPIFSNQSAISSVGPTQITGASALTFSNTSDIDGIGVLTATGAVTFSNLSAITSAGILAGASAVTFTNQGAIVAIGGLAGVSAPVFANGSAIGATALKSGVSSLAFSNQSTITGLGSSEMAGISAPSFTLQGLIRGDAYIVSAAAVAFANTATLTATGVLSGAAAVAFSNTSAITSSGILSGVAPAAFVNQGLLTGSAPGALSGVSSASFSGAANAGAIAQIAGTSAKVFRLQATFLGADLAEKWPPHAGRGKGKKPRRFVVDIDGIDFEVSSEAEAVALLEQAKDLAEKKAPIDLLVVSKKVRRRRQPIKEAIEAFPTPRLTTPDKALKAIVSGYQQEINQIYLEAARDAEIRELLRRKMREEEEEEALSILMLIA